MAASPAEDVARRFMGILDGRELILDEFMEFCAEDIEVAMFPPPSAGPRPPFREAMAASLGRFLRRRGQLHEVIADGDRAAMRYGYEAIVGFDGGPSPRGSLVGLEIARFITVRDGKMVRAYDYNNPAPPAGSAIADAVRPATPDRPGGGPTAEEIARRYIELCMDGASPERYSSDRFIDLFADDVDYREMPNTWRTEGHRVDPHAARPILTAGQFPLVNRKVALHEVIGEGGRAAFRYLWEATIGIDGLPRGKRGEVLRAEVAAFITVRDGKIVRCLEYVAPLPNG